jgi:hypothetical protein
MRHQRGHDDANGHVTRNAARAWIPSMLSGAEIWAQLLSEPGAGSGLADIQTRAARDGDPRGSKIWSSGAMSPTTASAWPERTGTGPRTRVSPGSRCRCTRPYRRAPSDWRLTWWSWRSSEA